MELTEIKIKEGSPLIGQSLSEISSRYKSTVLFCVIQRGSQVIIPDGQTIILEGDKVSLTGSMQDLENFYQEIKILKNHKIQEIMIVGGGRITFYLVRLLLRLGMEVKVIEKNKEVCLDLVERFPSVTVIHGDGTDHELLRSENLEDMDGFVALTDNDEEKCHYFDVRIQSGSTKRVAESQSRFSRILVGEAWIGKCNHAKKYYGQSNLSVCPCHAEYGRLKHRVFDQNHR